MKVGHVTERNENGQGSNQGGQLDTDEMDRAGIDLGATGRLQLMAKLAEGQCYLFVKLLLHKHHFLILSFKLNNGSFSNDSKQIKNIRQHGKALYFACV